MSAPNQAQLDAHAKAARLVYYLRQHAWAVGLGLNQIGHLDHELRALLPQLTEPARAEIDHQPGEISDQLAAALGRGLSGPLESEVRG